MEMPAKNENPLLLIPVPDRYKCAMGQQFEEKKIYTSKNRP